MKLSHPVRIGGQGVSDDEVREAWTGGLWSLIDPLRVPVEPEAAWKHVHRRLLTGIEVGAWLPGETLPSERQIAEKLEVSRVTVREALRHLEVTQYVASPDAKAGMIVQPREFDPAAFGLEHEADISAFKDDIHALLNYRRANELQVARIITTRDQSPTTPADRRLLQRAILNLEDAGDDPYLARRAGTLFHIAFAEAAHNPYLSKAIRESRRTLFRLLAEAHLSPFEKQVHSAEQHQSILNAIVGGRERDLCAAVNAHIDSAITRFDEHLTDVIARRKAEASSARAPSSALKHQPLHRTVRGT